MKKLTKEDIKKLRQQKAKQNTAILTVRLRHLEIVGESKEKVYDLMVDETHEYFANGILVHNCFDASGYACQHELR